METYKITPLFLIFFYSLSADGCDNLKLLTTAAISANILPVIKHTSVFSLPATQLNNNATSVGTLFGCGSNHCTVIRCLKESESDSTKS